MRRLLDRSILALVTIIVAIGLQAPRPSLGDEASGRIESARGRTILLVDDHDVMYRAGTKRVQHPAQRYSDKPVIAQTKPWEVAIGWTSVYRDPQTGKYQLWYQAYAGPAAGDKKLECVVCYAESTDGVTFTKPELDLFPFKEHARTNIVLIGSGGYGDRYCNSVIVEPQEKDASRRYKMAYYDFGVEKGREYSGMHAAFSADGIHWAKHPGGPLYPTGYGGRGLQPTFADENPMVTTQTAKGVRKHWSYPLTMSDAVDVFFDPRRGVYAIYGKIWLGAPDGTAAWKHGMGRTESKDFLHWSKPEYLVTPDDQDPPEIEFHTSPVFFHADRYFCLNQILDRAGGGTIDLELMTSADGMRWDRPFRDEYFLPRNAPGKFDGRAMFSNSTPVILDDEIRFYYGAYDQSPIGGIHSATLRTSGVGMASIPRDRFAGITTVAKSAQSTLRKPLEHIGQVTLKPLDLSGCREMTLNAATDAGGSVRVEVLDEDGHRLRGYSKDEAVKITGDRLRQPVRWQAKQLEQLPAGRYVLRLHLDHATVYALTFK